MDGWMDGWMEAFSFYQVVPPGQPIASSLTFLSSQHTYLKRESTKGAAAILVFDDDSFDANKTEHPFESFSKSVTAPRSRPGHDSIVT